MQVIEALCLSTAAPVCMVCSLTPHLLSPECYHTTTDGLSERPSATLPNFHTIRRSTLRSHQPTARHINGDVGGDPICPAGKTEESYRYHSGSRF